MTDRVLSLAIEGPTLPVERSGASMHLVVERYRRGRWQRAVVAVLLGCALVGCAVRKPVAPVVTMAGRIR